jgi:hypothetical protein
VAGRQVLPGSREGAGRGWQLCGVQPGPGRSVRPFHDRPSCNLAVSSSSPASQPWDHPGSRGTVLGSSTRARVVYWLDLRCIVSLLLHSRSLLISSEWLFHLLKALTTRSHSRRLESQIAQCTSALIVAGKWRSATSACSQASGPDGWKEGLSDADIAQVERARAAQAKPDQVFDFTELDKVAAGEEPAAQAENLNAHRAAPGVSAWSVASLLSLKGVYICYLARKSGRMLFWTEQTHCQAASPLPGWQLPPCRQPAWQLDWIQVANHPTHMSTSSSLLTRAVFKTLYRMR